MSYASQTAKRRGEECNESTKSRVRKSPVLVRVSIWLLIVGSTYGVCMRQAEESRGVQPTTQPKPASAPMKRPVTVRDFIQMTRLGDPLYDDGAPSKGLVAKFSPDGKRFVVILRKGNLEANTNEYSLVLFETSKVFRSSTPLVLLVLASSSNRPAIQNVVWMDDNDTLLLLGENPGETAQLYSYRCSSKELKKLTNHATNLTSFVATANAREIVFAAEGAEMSFVNEKSAREGIGVTSELLSDLIAGKHGGGESDDHALFVKQAGSDAEMRITTEGRVGAYHAMWLSADGLHLVLQTEATHVSPAWTEYDDQFLKLFRYPAPTQGAITRIFQYELVDIRTAAGRLLLDAPIPPNVESEVAWSPDSQSVIVSDMYLPLNIDDPAERARRKTHTSLAEIKIANRRLVKISDEDLRLLDWDAKTNGVVCEVGRTDSLTGKATRRAYFRKGDDNETWFRSASPQAPEKALPALPEIVLDENMNESPRILAIDNGTGRKSLLLDLNPQFQALALARVEEVAWKTSHNQEVRAGLYWPVDYVVGKKYPLVIQTHGWSADRFWIDGPWTTAFSAQALANKGFFVLQVSDPDRHLVDTPKEVTAAMAVYDSAVDFVDRKGFVDTARVGITGFSRTYLYVTYALTHSKHHFAAADITDGVDYGYMQYMEFSNFYPVWADELDRLNGSPPFGKGLLKWLKASPAFLMDAITTPLRIQTLGPASLLGDWHWFSGLTRLGKPVEMIYIPEGTHILEKPWDRMISQQGNVDWFCFWLKGEEDADPNKTEQYVRWRNLRLRDSKSSTRLKAQ
jgi:dipeptidyl aminopeptidase/acylaminoacyl peptidase